MTRVLLLLSCSIVLACDNSPQSIAQSTAALSTVNIVDKGGSVLPQVQIVEVHYGPGTYLPALTGGQMASFYRDLVNSSYVDWLAEYDTPKQTIGRGSYLGTYTITPSPANSGDSLLISQIYDELAKQIRAGHLPPTNGGSDLMSKNLYIVHLPRGTTASIQQGDKLYESCGPGNVSPDGTFWCGYHNLAEVFLPAGYADLFAFAVLPDFGPGSGCDVHHDPDYPGRLFTPCGTNGNFANLTAIASHEIVEAITDPSLGGTWIEQVTSPAVGREIADICERQYATFTGASGSAWTVQKAWSHVRNQCVAR